MSAAVYPSAKVDEKKYREGWDRIFGKKDPKCDTCKHWTKDQYRCEKWIDDQGEILGAITPSSAKKSWCCMHEEIEQ